MAHRLVGDRGSESHQTPRDDSNGERTTTLNRRQYVKLGAASVGVLATGSLGGAASDSGNTYYTDFSGGS
jgi:hypothetical protein